MPALVRIVLSAETSKNGVKGVFIPSNFETLHFIALKKIKLPPQNFETPHLTAIKVEKNTIHYPIKPLKPLIFRHKN